MLSEKIKNYWKKIPFVWKSFLIYVPLFASVFTFFLFLALIEIRSSNNDKAKSIIQTKMESIKQNFDPEEFESLAENLQISIYSEKGRILKNINHFQTFDPTDKLEEFQILNEGQIILLNTLYERNGTRFILQAAKNMQPEKQVIDSLKNFFILIIFSGLFISAALSIPLTKLSLRGIRKMAETAEQISYENLSKRIEVTGAGDEFDLLANTLNEMIDRIQISAEAQKRFISNASHELRTPIAVIKGYARLLTRWGLENKETLKESAEAINLEVETIQTLLEDLLMMTRVDSKLADMKVEEIDIITLIHETMKDNAILYAHRDFNFQLESTSSFKTLGDRWLIKALLRIFTENANKYSPEDKSVDYNLIGDDNRFKISIADHGNGIPDEHKNKVFQRFYRVDEDRSREKGGSGLGMAIAKRIVSLHKGNLWIEDTLGGGATIIIEFQTSEKEGEQSDES